MVFIKNSQFISNIVNKKYGIFEKNNPIFILKLIILYKN